jgi:hypothetical protein
MVYCRSHSFSQRFARPGGAQKLPGGWLQRVVVGAWLRSYLVVLVVSSLGTNVTVGSFLSSVALPPVMLFLGLSVLGCLEGRPAWSFAVVWAGLWWLASVLLVLAWW